MEINNVETISSLAKQDILNADNNLNGASFETSLMDELNNVNNNIVTADKNIKDLALGENKNLHEVMLSIQNAKLSLEMLMKVRDRALEGIHEILRMQV